ncbi:MAG TPA: glutamine-hydrolyzing GMP synthase [Patescibacteria group bacterium]|nr:glutamine-hydrolyzing GMP synthase [Patescibacteria group bacterium]
MIYIIDFGSQTAHLIERRIRELGQETLFITPQKALKQIKLKKPHGIILSGGPASVYENGAPTIEREIFSLGIPILGICYGFQLAAHLMDGKVISGKKEYGPAVLNIKNAKSRIMNGVGQDSKIWMSHGDEIIKLPKGFTIVGSTPHVKSAAAEDEKNKLYMIQFHPEVEHTDFGMTILRNFVDICGLKIGERKFDLKQLMEDIKEKAENSYVIGAISGGVDSTVAGILTAEAIGSKFIPVYVENGLMRKGTAEFVSTLFKKHGINPIIANVEDEMLTRLKGVSDPEKKRKVIGKFYIDVFEREMEKQIKKGRDVKFLLQGTIYSDVIESKGTKHASKIKSHHNVGGLPKDMKLKLIEPLRYYYKDEVRKIGLQLGLPDSFVWRQTFPGPGYAVRIRGEVTKKRLEQEKAADVIVLEEIERAGWLRKVYMSYPIMSGADSTAVKGDGRFFGEVVALRVVESIDVMTAVWSRLPYDVLQTISSRIVNEVPGISRVVYDISTKPPATMEWE